MTSLPVWVVPYASTPPAKALLSKRFSLLFGEGSCETFVSSGLSITAPFLRHLVIRPPPPVPLIFKLAVLSQFCVVIYNILPCVSPFLPLFKTQVRKRLLELLFLSLPVVESLSAESCVSFLWLL